MSFGPGKSGRRDLSVVIPVLDEQAQIHACLAGLRAQRFDGNCEIVVVDGDPRGGTIGVIRDDSITCLTSARGRARQMNAGAAVAAGEILLFLHADTRLPPHGLEKVVAVMATGRYVAGAFDLGIDSKRLFLRCIAAGASIRARVNRVPYGDQAVFIRRESFAALGGYKEIPIMEDIDLMRRIRKAGGRIRILEDKVMTSPRRWEAEGPLHTTFRNQIIRLLYYLGVSPERLVRFYRVQS